MRVIKSKNLFVGDTLITHHCCTNLAKSHTMPPAFSMQDEAILRFLHLESRRIQMRLAEPLTDFQFLAHRQRTFLAHNLHCDDSTRSTTFYRNKVKNTSKVNARLSPDEFTQFISRVTHRPSIEIHRLLVIVVQHLRKNTPVPRIAVRVSLCRQIRVMNGLPA